MASVNRRIESNKRLNTTKLILSRLFIYLQKVPGAGLEPARPCGQQILSLSCLPFHHPGFFNSNRGFVPNFSNL